MSVFTAVSEPELRNFLTAYQAGSLASYQGITAGIENTNYFVATTSGDYVLTLIESLPKQRLEFVLQFIAHLNHAGFPCARLLIQNNGQLYSSLHQRPALLVERLAGSPLVQPTVQQSHCIGQSLASMHQVSSSFPDSYPEHLPDWCQEGSREIIHLLTNKQKQLLNQALVITENLDWSLLESGPIHADLFPDNALFAGDQLIGIIDFYHACNSPFLYDLAVTLNAWSYQEPDGQLNHSNAEALLDAYQQQRPLSVREKQALPALRVTAALRFWLSRLQAQLEPADGLAVTRKDPQGMEKLLRLLIS